MPTVGKRFSDLPGSGLQEMAILARGVEGAVALGVGDPNFTTPGHIIDAAARAAHDGFTHYAPAAGLQSLRDAIAAKVTERNQLDCSAAGVAVTTGASGGLFTALSALIDPGDEVLIPDPGWPTYPAMVHLLGGVPKYYPLPRALDFVPDLGALRASITPRTRAIIVSSPANPTGVILGETTLRDLVAVASDSDLWVLSDECYDEIVLEGHHYSTARFDKDGRVVTIFTFSKTYAMTGWRVGYVVAHPEIASAVAKAQRPVNSATSTVAQKAAEAALNGSQDCVREMVRAYRERRDLTMRLLDEGGVTYVVPQGAFYVMADVPGPSNEFARNLLQMRRVGVAPGRAFGAEAEGTVRVSLAVSAEDIQEGIPRLAAAVREATVVAPT